MEMMSDAPEERPSEASEVLVRLEALGCPLEKEKRAAVLRKLVVRPARKHLPKPRIDIIGIIFKWLPEILLALLAAFLICRLKGWV